MSNQGLSIFDHEPDDFRGRSHPGHPHHERTQGRRVCLSGPVVRRPPRRSPNGRREAAATATGGARRRRPQAAHRASHRDRHRPRGVRNVPRLLRPGKPPSLPTVRRGGYDTAAVDNYLRTRMPRRQDSSRA